MPFAACKDEKEKISNEMRGGLVRTRFFIYLVSCYHKLDLFPFLKCTMKGFILCT